MKEKKDLPLIFATDENYAPFFAAAAASVLANVSEEYDCTFYLLNAGLEASCMEKLESFFEGRAKLVPVDVKEKLAFCADALHLRDYYTATTYYRFFIPDLFPDFGKCLYLDCDILVRGDISKLYETELGPDNWLGAVTDDIVSTNPLFSLYSLIVLGVQPKDYINAGILVMDLDALRRIEVEKQFLRLAKKRRLPVAQDQDYLNLIARGHILNIGHEWNYTPVPLRWESEEETDPMLVHFKMNYKPWHYRDIPYEDEFWRHAAKTPFIGLLRDMLSDYGEEDMERDARQAEALEDLAGSEVCDIAGISPAGIR